MTAPARIYSGDDYALAAYIIRTDRERGIAPTQKRADTFRRYAESDRDRARYYEMTSEQRANIGNAWEIAASMIEATLSVAA